MSFSMLLGRVVLPLAGLALATALVWSTSGGGRFALPSLSASPGDAQAGAGAGAGPGTGTGADSQPEAPATIIAEGRMVTYPGAQVVVGAEATGTIVRVAVVEKSAVKRGDVLIEFRSDELRAQVAEAAARLAEVEADVSRLEADFQRADSLLNRNAGSRQDYDRTRFNFLAQCARRDAMAAGRDRLVAQLARYRVVAPIDGVVTARQAQPGETVAAATPLVTIANLTRLRIEAEVDEYDIAHCRVGRPATIRAEGYPDQSWRGEVEEIADVLSGRRIRPEDPGKPTDTRVLPVRIVLREPTPLRLGQRVEVEIDRSTPADSSAPLAQSAAGSGPRR
jgi:RND family efflux transporter MFP subunit